jgi:hypothetical protein
MTDSSDTTAGLAQADEEVLTDTVSDEALEAAAGTEGVQRGWTETWTPGPSCC